MVAPAATAADGGSTPRGIVPQAFESEILGVPVAKLDLLALRGADLVALSREWLAAGQWLVSGRVPEDDRATRKALEAVGFRAVETLVTFYQPARPATPVDQAIDLASAGEVDACVRLALDAFTYDRLHRDPLVPETAADAVRAAWVRNDVGGRAAAPLVARRDGRVIGFNLCLLTHRTAVIDLIAVEAGHRGLGLGAALIEAAFGHFGAAIDGIRVGTQAENPASIRLYEKTGFSVERRETTLHWVNPGVTPDGAD